MAGDRTLQDLLATVAAHGERDAIVSFGEGGTWTFATLADRAARLAAGLVRQGLAHGEPVILFAPNRPEWVATALGLFAAGAVIVPLDLLMGEEELAHAIRDSGSRRAFTTGERLEALRKATAGGADLEVFLLDGEAGQARSWTTLLADRPGEGEGEGKGEGEGEGEGEGKKGEGEEKGDLPAVAAQDRAALFYTSGTTGRPKGVPLTHANLRFNLDGLLAEGVSSPGERILLPLPLYHVYPFTVGMLMPLATGATLIFPAGISGPEIVHALNAGRATAVIGVPRLYGALAAAIRSRVTAQGRFAALLFRVLLGLSTAVRKRTGRRLGRMLFRPLHRVVAPELSLLACGGAKLDPDLAWDLEGLGWEVLTGYGLTETSPIVTFNTRGQSRPDTTGRALSGVEIRLDSPDAAGCGEVQVRGPNVFAGYHKNPAATAAAFTDDGWFQTGDLGIVDDAGFLRIVGRTSETIVLADGKNILPEEVEAVYAESPYIREVAVLEKAGSLVALVVPDADAFRRTGAGRIEEAIREALRGLSQKLPPYRRVTDYAVVHELLPRTPLGKLRRHLLPGIFTPARKGPGATAPAPLSEADRELLAKPAARKVWAWLKRRYPDKGLTLDAYPQLDLGIDSLDWVRLTLEIQEELGVHLTEEAVARVVTVRDLLCEAVGAPAGAPPQDDPDALSPELARWLAPTGPFTALLGRLLYAADRPLMRAVYHLRILGQHNLPPHGPFILAPNHTSFLDPFVIAAAVPADRSHRICWGGITAILFKTPIRRLFSRAARILPVDPDRRPRSSLAFGTAVLKRGDILIWFPEGGRSPSGTLQPFTTGIGALMEETHAPVLPVAISGTFEAWPVRRRFPRLGSVTVTFGKPLHADALASAGRGETSRQRIADALHGAVAALAGESKPE